MVSYPSASQCESKLAKWVDTQRNHTDIRTTHTEERRAKLRSIREFSLLMKNINRECQGSHRLPRIWISDVLSTKAMYTHDNNSYTANIRSWGRSRSPRKKRSYREGSLSDDRFEWLAAFGCYVRPTRVIQTTTEYDLYPDQPIPTMTTLELRFVLLNTVRSIRCNTIRIVIKIDETRDEIWIIIVVISSWIIVAHSCYQVEACCNSHNDISTIVYSCYQEKTWYNRHNNISTVLVVVVVV